MMSSEAGVLRDDASLAVAVDDALEVAHRPVADVASAELRNLATLGVAVASAARLRTETRGAHTRTDFPESDDDLVVRMVIM